MSLSQTEIKQQELKLLEISGFCLAQFSESQSNPRPFRDVSHLQSQKQLSKLSLLKTFSTGLSSNANIKAFAYILLQTIYHTDFNEDLLDYLKSFLYNEQLDLTSIKHNSIPQYSNNEMKKLLVEFFYSISYSNQQDRVQSKLCKYPVILEILVLLIRKILEHLKVKNAQDYIFNLHTKDIYPYLLDYFDLNYKVQGKIYLFYQQNVCIFETQHGQILVGIERVKKQTKVNGYHRTFMLQDLEEQYEEEEQSQNNRLRKSQERSLEFKGIVSQSLVFDPDTVTPFFYSDQQNMDSFKSSKEVSLAQDRQYQRDSLIRRSLQANPLKRKDMMQCSQTLGLGANINMKRTIVIEDNQFNPQNYEPFRNILDSPITIDSPHTLSINTQKFPANFLQNKHERSSDHAQKIKSLKKSKSQKMNNTFVEDSIDISGNNFQGYSQNVPQKSKNHVKKPPRSSHEPCRCVEKKKEKNSLNSHLYQINLYRMKPEAYCMKKKDVFYQNFEVCSKVQSFRASKGAEDRYSLQNSFDQGFSNTSFKKVNTIFHRNNHPMNQSTFSLSNNSQFIPMSETATRKGYSPVSNYTAKSKSPHGSRSITPPKITFSYNAPLKYSTILKNQKKKK